MITLTRFLALPAFLTMLLPLSALAQQPGRPVLLSPSQPTVQKAVLSANYTITVTILQDDKPVGEATVLTASPQLMTTVPVSHKDSETEGVVSISGHLAENDDSTVNFDYQLGFQLSTKAKPAPQPGTSFIQSSNQQQNQSTGTVIAKLGKPYDLLKAGGCTFRVVIDKAKE